MYIKSNHILWCKIWNLNLLPVRDNLSKGSIITLIQNNKQTFSRKTVNRITHHNFVITNFPLLFFLLILVRMVIVCLHNTVASLFRKGNMLVFILRKGFSGRYNTDSMGKTCIPFFYVDSIHLYLSGKNLYPALYKHRKHRAHRQVCRGSTDWISKNF